MLPRTLTFILFFAACTPASRAPTLSDKRIGHCAYVGTFSKMNECTDYLGEWKVADAEKDCTTLKGTFESGTICSGEGALGMCLLAAKPEQNRTYIISTNAGKCGSARTGCETFGGGYWEPSAFCGGANDELVVLENAWKLPSKICITPDGGSEVCVWNAIHGATREGRSFREDAVCDNSRSGRPYYAKDADARYSQTDARRTDATYLAEEAWVKSQINASSCVCCHSNAAPNAEASIFNIDRDGSLANQLTDRGIAHGAGLVNSIPLGAFPPQENNGFSKSDLARPDDSIFLTTDPPRMKRFWVAELAHRNLTAANFEGVPDGFGPLSEQYYWKPEACIAGEGIAADGTITWGRGRARYVYLMETTSHAPTVWPNLDMPSGTLWRLDVPATAAPLVSGTVKYGVVPEGLSQHFPVAGAPASLVSGQQYFLYVSADQMLPITRCLITAP